MKKVKSKNSDITATISAEEFLSIVRFVLENGDRRTYCNMYNNNPHYKMEGFHVYLNPIDQRINMVKESLSNEVSDYNSITLWDIGLGNNFQYYRVELSDDKVYLWNYRYNNKEEFNFARKAFERIYYPKIINGIRSKE